MAFYLTYTSPRYDNLDRCVGSFTSRCEELGTFETLAWAEAKADLLGRETYGEIDFRVHRTDGQPLYPRPVSTIMAFEDDIPF